MANRRPIKQAHERANVQNFLDWLNRRCHSNFNVESEPDPPEAIIRSSKTVRWVEVSTAFWNNAYAQDLYSFATPDEVHKSVKRGPHQNMDDDFAHSFVSVVRKKLEKESYLHFRDQFGPGYLVVPIKYPWFDSYTVASMKNVWASHKIADLGCFRSVYFAPPSGGRSQFVRWAPRKA